MLLHQVASSPPGPQRAAIYVGGVNPAGSRPGTGGRSAGSRPVRRHPPVCSGKSGLGRLESDSGSGSGSGLGQVWVWVRPLTRFSTCGRCCSLALRRPCWRRLAGLMSGWRLNVLSPPQGWTEWVRPFRPGAHPHVDMDPAGCADAASLTAGRAQAFTFRQ